MKYDTLREAEKALGKQKSQSNPTVKDMKFCPLINQDCVARCVCYLENYVAQVAAGEFEIKEGGCGNSMFFED